jgi:hypothetical protein
VVVIKIGAYEKGRNEESPPRSDTRGCGGFWRECKMKQLKNARVEMVFCRLVMRSTPGGYERVQVGWGG